MQKKEIKEGEYKKIDYTSNKPVIYFFILNNDLDPIIDSQVLMEDYKALRPIRQKCGVLSGATQVKKDFYSKYVSIRVCLENYIEYEPKYTQEYLFPSSAEDRVLNNLLQIAEKEKFEKITPFYIDKH